MYVYVRVLCISHISQDLIKEQLRMYVSNNNNDDDTVLVASILRVEQWYSVREPTAPVCPSVTNIKMLWLRLRDTVS